MDTMPRFVFAALALAIAGLLPTAPVKSADDDEKQPSRAMLGKKIPNLSFRTGEGKRVSLYDLKDKKAIVVVFLSFDCPVSNSYSKPLADIHEAFHEYGVSLLGLTTNEDQTAAEVARLAKEYKIPFPVMIDRDLKAADALGADITPEVFVLDGNYVLRYRGRIDNAFYARLKRNHQVSCHDLHQALGELMSGRPLSATATVPIGCPIQRALNTAKDGPVTYYRDVLPILQKNCQQCHRPGEVGQFSLMKYRQAVIWGADIEYFTKTRYMPPWKPSGGAFPFHNERKLTKKDIKTLAKWVECKMPMGRPQDAPPPRTFTEGWQLGKPDLVLQMPAEFQVGADGHDVFRCFVLPTNLTEDKHVRAVEIRPGNPRIVHHALLFIDTSGKARRLETLEKEGKNKLSSHHANPVADDKGPGYSVDMGVGFTPSGGMGGWAPGVRARFLPENYSYFLPKKSDVVLQVHYHRNGRREKDRTRIGIYFSKKPNPPLYQSGVMAGTDGAGVFFKIPARDPAYKLRGSVWAAQDCKLFSVMPHMHLLGKSIKVTMTPPAGKTSTLLDIKEWDYNWQEVYFFKNAIRVKKGTRFDVEAIYDNSDKNPHNPNSPPKDVTYGDQTTDEMCFVFFGGASARAGRRLPLSFRAPPAVKKPGNRFQKVQ